jgi:CheY-like chemotaxis protein
MSPRVLLVEDEDDARTSLVRAIERGGRSCTGAASVAGAIAAA